MKKSGEWGQFFPMDLCAFAYNEAFVMDQFPLTKEEVLKRGWKWHEQEENDRYMGEKIALPETVAGVDDSICKKILQCAVTGKPYKIIPQELKFHRQLDIPLPSVCPDQRHRERQARRNPYRLFERKCGNCKTDVTTTYAPDRPEPIVCEKCFLSLVY